MNFVIIYIWLVVLTIGVGYLFYTAFNLLIAVSTLQKSELVRQEELYNKLVEENNKLDN